MAKTGLTLRVDVTSVFPLSQLCLPSTDSPGFQQPSLSLDGSLTASCLREEGASAGGLRRGLLGPQHPAGSFGASFMSLAFTTHRDTQELRLKGDLIWFSSEHPGEPGSTSLSPQEVWISAFFIQQILHTRHPMYVRFLAS